MSTVEAREAVVPRAHAARRRRSVSRKGPQFAPETELKFELEPAALERLGRHPLFQAPAKTAHLRSVYFDTPEFKLKNGGFSLRVRHSDQGFVQTLKRRSGSGLFERDEWEREVDAEAPDAKAIAETPAGEVVNGDSERLEPVFTSTVERDVRMFEDDRALIEVSLDQGEITTSDQSEAIREVELELKAGERVALFTLARDLVDQAGLRLSFESKSERGYRLAEHSGLTARKAEVAGLKPGMCSADAFRHVVRGGLVQISSNAALLRRARTPESLHQARVGLRRLRAALGAFSDMLAGGGYHHLKGEMRWLAHELGEARDLDVFIDATFRPAAAASEEPALDAFGDRLMRAQAKAYDRAVAAIESPRFSKLLLETAAWAEVGDWTSNPRKSCKRLREEPISAFARRSLQRLYRKLRKRGARFDTLDVEGRHRLRIAGKKLVYASDLLGPVFGGHPKRRRRFISALKGLQDGLGALNDLAVAPEVALKSAGAREPELAFAAGEIVGRRRAEEGPLIKAAASAWDELKDHRPFWRDR